MAIAGGIDRVFEVGPVLRAEPSFTSRHATEFTGVDVELAGRADLAPAGERAVSARILAETGHEFAFVTE